MSFRYTINSYIYTHKIFGDYHFFKINYTQFPKIIILKCDFLKYYTINFATCLWLKVIYITMNQFLKWIISKLRSLHIRKNLKENKKLWSTVKKYLFSTVIKFYYFSLLDFLETKKKKNLLSDNHEYSDILNFLNFSI